MHDMLLAALQRLEARRETRRPRAALAALPTGPNPVEGSDSWQAPPAAEPDSAARLEAAAQPPDAPGYPNPASSGHEALERGAGAAAPDSAASAARSAAGGGAARGSGSGSGSGSVVRALVTWTGNGCAAALGLAAAGEAAGGGCWTTRCCRGWNTPGCWVTCYLLRSSL